MAQQDHASDKVNRAKPDSLRVAKSAESEGCRYPEDKDDKESRHPWD